MLGRTRSMSLAMLTAVIAGSFSGAQSFAESLQVIPGDWTTPRLIGGNGDQRKVGNYPRSGRATTAAQVKRASKKARNVARHKKHA